MAQCQPLIRVPVTVAAEILEIVSNIGNQGLVAFSLSRLDHYESKHRAEFNDIIHICFNGAQYIRMWLNEEETPSNPTDIKLESLIDIANFNFNALTNGVYYLDFNGDEGHHFVWVIINNDLTLASTYGGVKNIGVVTYDKTEYLTSFKQAMLGSMEDYAYVFDAANPAVNRVGFEDLTIVKSLKYY
jgi:hypothetical protein